MSIPIHHDDSGEGEISSCMPLTDGELRDRTQALIEAARSISLELTLQTERLAVTIDKFNREVIEPMRHLKGDDHD